MGRVGLSKFNMSDALFVLRVYVEILLEQNKYNC